LGYSVVFQSNETKLTKVRSELAKQIKTFVGINENGVKSQIIEALINYLLLELINSANAKKTKLFSNFVIKIKVCVVSI
jgi:hypothetical protein